MEHQARGDGKSRGERVAKERETGGEGVSHCYLTNLVCRATPSFSACNIEMLRVAWHTRLLYNRPPSTFNAHPLLVSGNPVSGGKPLVLFNVLNTVPQVSKPLCQINLKKITKKIL